MDDATPQPRAVPELLPDLAEEVVAIIRRSRALHREQARTLHPRFDPSAFPLVGVLAQEGAMRLSELAEALWMDKSTASRQVDSVERFGLVERVPDPADARARMIQLTDDGRERMAAMQAEQRRRWESALSGWDPEEVEELTRLLRRLRGSGVA